MAVIKSDIYQVQDGTLAPNKSPMGSYNGRVRSLYFEVTPANAAVATTDIIKLCKIPPAARIVGWRFLVPDVGTAGTAKVGWTASVDGKEVANDVGFGAATAFTTSGGAFGVPAVADAGLFKKFVSEVDAQMVFTVAADAGNVLIKGHFTYVID